jgi:hypothetical protein
VLKTQPGWTGSTLKVRNVTASGSASDPEHGGYEGYAPANAFTTNGGECLHSTALQTPCLDCNQGRMTAQAWYLPEPLPCGCGRRVGGAAR